MKRIGNSAFQIATDTADAQVPGPLYPDRCLDCCELTRETYGCVCRLRCADCATADRMRRRVTPARLSPG